MPPETVALSTLIPIRSNAGIVPALLTAPPMLLLLMVMPVAVGAVVPVGVMTPVQALVTLPVTLALFSMKMQLAVVALVTAATVPPFSVILQAGNAGAAPAPINSAATELEASKRCGPRRAPPHLRRIHLPA